MPTLSCLPDNKTITVGDGETVLRATLGADIPHAHACGGLARCSTCRVWVLDGLEHCAERSDDERALADPLGFSPELRLACQMRISGDVKIRRLVLDEADLEIASKSTRGRPGPVGESKKIVVMFADIRGFTTFSEPLSAYDVMYVLNRYCHQMGEIIEHNRGYIDNFIGDGIMSLFGVEPDAHAPLRGVKAGVEMLAAMDRLKLYLEAMYHQSLDLRVGLHYGEAVIGTLGSASTQKLTAIGDTVNVASRIEAANKDAGTRLLISEELYEAVKDDVEMDDFIRVKLRGTAERKTLYEISAIKPAALERVTEYEVRDETRQRFAGMDWLRVLPEAELEVGGRKVIARDDFDLLVIRTAKTIYVTNNACPHLNLPLNDSEVTEDDGIVCRWHESCFDLASGEIREWGAALEPDGTSSQAPYLGDVSKNRRPMTMFPARITDGFVWVALD